MPRRLSATRSIWRGTRKSGAIIVGGSKSRTFISRAIGPSLTGAGVSNPLPDPKLMLHNGSGTIVASNDNWRSAQEQQIRQSGLAPQSDKESAILTTLAPGAYTAVVSGADEGSGVALIEVYQVR